MAKRKPAAVAKLTEAEEDLISRMRQGYQLETDLLGGDLVLRSKDDEVIRPALANRNTVKGLQERGLIQPGKGRDPLTIVWHMKTKAKK